MKHYLRFRDELRSMRETDETLRIMEKVAGSHIHILRKRVASLVAYKEQLERLICRLAHFYWNDRHPFFQRRERGGRLLVVLTGDRGVVGGLFHMLAERALQERERWDHLWVVGRRGAQYLQEEGIPFRYIETEGTVDFDEALQRKASLGNYLFQAFLEGSFREIAVLYPSFRSLARQEAKLEQLLSFPLVEEAQRGREGKEEIRSGDGLPIFEPSRWGVFDALVQRYGDIAFRAMVFDATLAELAARMVAAENASQELEQQMLILHRRYLKEWHGEVSRKQIEAFVAHQAV